MLCHRGCGIEGTYLNYRGLPCCDKSAQKCPVVRKKIGDASGETRRKTPCLRSEEHKIEQAKRIKKQWDDGKRTVTDNLISHAKNLHTFRDAAWNKGVKTGQIPWNKGLKKQESLEILAREDPAYSNFKKYRNRVAVRTRKTYEQYVSEINPNDLPIGKCGIEGAHQVDHIITVREGFERGIAIEEISAKENLQVIPWLENIQKYDGKGLRKINQ
jgi:hypothetical protein